MWRPVFCYPQPSISTYLCSFCYCPESTVLSFEIKLPLFEGPFDLLLFFIERDELDIYDIPIAGITNDFLAYLNQLEQLNMEVASEFILVAATLMRIKAKMLLPRVEVDEEGNEIDPREELVQHLLEYKKYKAVLKDLGQLEQLRQMQENRGNTAAELHEIALRSNTDTELQDLTLYKLLRAFDKAINRYEEEQARPKHTVYQYPYSIDDQKKYLITTVKSLGKLSFAEVISSYNDRIGIIFNFLALLELLQAGEIGVEVGDGYNSFWITAEPVIIIPEGEEENY